MDTHRHRPTSCPGCGNKLDASSGNDGVPPKAGDASLCWYCGALLLYREDLTLRPMSTLEKVEHLEDPTFRRIHAELMEEIRSRARERANG